MALKADGDSFMPIQPCTMHVPAEHEPDAGGVKRRPQRRTLGGRNLHRHFERPIPPSKGRNGQRIVMQQQYAWAQSWQRRQPGEIRIPDPARAVPALDASPSNSNRKPRDGNGIQRRQKERAEVFHKGRRAGNARCAPIDCRVETASSCGNDGWQIPCAKHQPGEVASRSRVPPARGEIVVAVNDGRPAGHQQFARGERVECALEQRRLPAVEQIARKDEMVGRTRQDAIELMLEPAQVGVVSQVRIREMGYQQCASRVHNYQVPCRCDTVPLVSAPSASGPAIAVRGVHLARGRAGAVLRGLDLEIATGETLALVGRSGAGKSTLLKLINGLIVPDRGSVIVEGRDTRDWNPFALRRRIGYVLQEIGLFPHMSVARNVGVVPRLLRWDAARTTARVAEMLTLVGLPPETYAHRSALELSGGQRQRVGVARALAADPPILLMDEPFGALDPVTRAELHREFRRIQSAMRKTVVIVTHDMAEAFALAGRVGVLDEGVIAQIDAPRELAKSTDARVRPLLEPLFEARAFMP